MGVLAAQGDMSLGQDWECPVLTRLPELRAGGGAPSRDMGQEGDAQSVMPGLESCLMTTLQPLCGMDPCDPCEEGLAEDRALSCKHFKTSVICCTHRARVAGSVCIACGLYAAGSPQVGS